MKTISTALLAISYRTRVDPRRDRGAIDRRRTRGTNGVDTAANSDRRRRVRFPFFLTITTSIPNPTSSNKPAFWRLSQRRHPADPVAFDVRADGCVRMIRRASKTATVSNPARKLK